MAVLRVSVSPWWMYAVGVELNRPADARNRLDSRGRGAPAGGPTRDVYSVHGARNGLDIILTASASPTMVSFARSHVIGRPRLMHMSVRWHIMSERTAE